MLKNIMITLAILLTSGLVIYSLYFNHTTAPNATLISLSGQQLSIAALKGKVVLINFWATDCAGCIEEMPRFKKLYQRYTSQGFEILAVAMHYDMPTYVQAFANKNQLPFFVALDPQGKIAQAFGHITLTPTTFLLDKQGNIVKRYVGSIDINNLQQLIEYQLKN